MRRAKYKALTCKSLEDPKRNRAVFVGEQTLAAKNGAISAHWFSGSVAPFCEHRSY